MSINRHTVSLYWAHMRKHRVSFFAALVCIPLGTLLIDTILPYVASQVVGALSSNQHDHAVVAAWLAAGLGLAGATANFVGFRALTRHEADVTHELMHHTYHDIITKDAAFFAGQKTGAMTTNFGNFIIARVMLQDLLIMQTLGFVLNVTIGIGILLTQSWPLALLVTGFLIALIIQVKWSIRHRSKWRTRRREIRSDIYGDVADTFTNNTIVKTFAHEAIEAANLEQKSQAYRHAFMRDIGFIASEGSARVALMVVVQIIAAFTCIYFVTRGEMTIAIAVFIIAYMQRLGSQMFSLGSILNGYDQALLDAEPMTKMLLHSPAVVDAPHAGRLAVAHPTITFDHVSYRYSDSKQTVIRDISLTIPAGQKVGLVGHSGAGKTTMTHLLLRFADPTSGEIRIDNHDIAKVTQQSLRQAISFVPQEPLLFHRSLRDNIAYGKPDACEDEIIAAAKRANAWEFIAELADGLDTLVGERGIKLSGGQRQRVAIARAILKDAPILILDEATSALDSESEKLIQASLGELMHGRTSIVIAHRLSTIAKLDRIIVLNHGQIVEDGTHAELLARGGTYAKLWAHQSGGFIEE